MLNCTDLECILHHHHYYAHLHHLKHGTHVEEGAMSTETEGFNDETIRGLLNDTGMYLIFFLSGLNISIFNNIQPLYKGVRSK
jgi:hypothetical protein